MAMGQKKLGQKAKGKKENLRCKRTSILLRLPSNRPLHWKGPLKSQIGKL